MVDDLFKKTLGDMNSASEQEKLAAVSQNPQDIRYIQNPSEAVQLAAVQNNGRAIRYIKQPSEVVQLNAVRNTPFALTFIRTKDAKSKTVILTGILALLKGTITYKGTRLVEEFNYLDALIPNIERFEPLYEDWDEWNLIENALVDADFGTSFKDIFNWYNKLFDK